MLSKKMTTAINDQMNREIYSAYLYMSMSSFSSYIGLKGFANWFMVQYHEEMYHGMKMYEYIQRQGECAKLQAHKKLPVEWESPLDMFEKTLEHELKVTKWINELMDLAVTEKDHASQIFFQWYVTEQLEEEENDNDIIARLKLIKSNAQGLIMLDQELGGRVASVPLDYSKGLAAAEAGA